MFSVPGGYIVGGGLAGVDGGHTVDPHRYLGAQPHSTAPRTLLTSGFSTRLIVTVILFTSLASS